ncbi:hypothetical protein [Flavobacterium polysaccharolyticum]|uniref:Uncharacterized protein n=1 Tax=Flavobacterium polysaccharolyticum TaxID=3133148 RepID=A0ABU9NTK2_9FLAO
MGKLIKPMGGITDHFFVAIKNTDGSYKFIDVQNKVEYTKEAMDKTFSSYKAFEVK